MLQIYLHLIKKKKNTYLFYLKSSWLQNNNKLVFFLFLNANNKL